MIFYLLLFCLLSNSMVLTVSSQSTEDCPIDPPNYDFSNKMTCFYHGFGDNYNNGILEPKIIPHECYAIFYMSFEIDQKSVINVDEEHLDTVTALNKPVIVALSRKEEYSGWSAILTKDGNANETNMLCEFAKKHNVSGYQLNYLAPSEFGGVVDKQVTINIIPYIKQLKEKCPFLIIAVGIATIEKHLSNKDLYNFKELNKVVTYYYADTVILNGCNPDLYNGVTPITKNPPGKNHLYGLEEVMENLKKTEICFNKLSFAIAVLTAENVNNSNPTYTEMCKGQLFDNSTWCVQASQNYYDKGQYIREQKAGITVVGLDWDDYYNSCQCQSAFNGFYNVLAGYMGGEVKSCPKFDIQSLVYPIK